MRPADSPAADPVVSETDAPQTSRSAGPRRAALSRAQVLALAAAVAVGIFAGLGLFTFGYGEGHAYLRDDPAACANCHVMQGHFDSWTRSSHRSAATCNDCHLSHDPVGKWVVKADNGFFHSLAFTTGEFHEPIRIKPRNRRVTQRACLHCHADLVEHLLPVEPGGEAASCVHCHADVGHAAR